MENEPRKPKKNPLQDYAKYSGLGAQMILTILAGTYAGIRLDRHFFPGSHWLTIVFTLLSVSMAVYMVLRKI